jgi:peptidoglycan/xylan/chitin deacetylase (PgdA/CDA1 family)
MSVWPKGARLALSFVVNVEEGSEMSIARGDRGPEPVDELGVTLRKAVRNYANESNYHYGIKAGAPRVMALLEKYELTATFTAAAQSLELAPELAARIAQGGHEVCSHGWRWIHQYQMDEPTEREFINKAVQSIEKTVGERPVGWLSRYLLTENTRRLLREAGFLYHMDDYSDDLPFWPEPEDVSQGTQGAGAEGSSADGHDNPPLLVIPYALDSNDMKMWSDPAYTPHDWLRYAKDTFDWLYAEGSSSPKMMSLGLHLRVIGRPGRIGYLEQFIEHVKTHPDVWVTTRKAIAQHWATKNPAPAALL